ncbi:MAG: SH3 domain-containing protein [Scytolyngbya sp. HA4215-MV1]|nr:SH3 domain-containing protein [Scytolyngbya sp. HA4215-MV1]
MKWSGVVKVLVGLAIAIAIFAVAGVLAFRYISQMTSLPPRPTFPNDQPSAKVKPSTAVAQPKTQAKPKPTPTPSKSPSPTATDAATYPARINLSQGLNVRDAPSVDANRIGGVDYNEQVSVLEESADGEWQRIRVESSGLEGWIKSGYSERIDEHPKENQ